VIVLASQGFLSLESGISLILGANIGTCVTAALSAVGRTREAVQAALVHILFNSLGVVLLLPFIQPFAEVIRVMSPVSDQVGDAARVAAEAPRQIANAHTVFNVGSAFVFIWLTGPLARLVDWIVPVRKEVAGVRPVYLEEIYLEEPDFALDQVRRELTRLGDLDRDILQRSLRVAMVGTRADVAVLRQADDDVDNLHGAIVTFLGQLSQQNLDRPQSRRLYELFGIANYLENIGDVVESSLLEDAGKRLDKGVNVSQSTMEVLRPIHEKVLWAFDRMLAGLRDGDVDAAHEAADSKAAVNSLADAATDHLAKRLVAGEPNRLPAFQIETDTTENLKRVNTLTRRIARSLLIILTNDKPRKKESAKSES
jgi:phosphate:Na+ symporter